MASKDLCAPLISKGVLRSFFILDVLNVLIQESTLLFTRTQTERICLRYPQPIAQFVHVLKKRFDERYFCCLNKTFYLYPYDVGNRGGFYMLARSREVISDVFSASIMCKPLTMKTIVSHACCTSGGLVSWINYCALQHVGEPFVT